MNALIEILAQLIEAVPSETWLEQTFYTLTGLKSPKARLFDACLFRQSASGGLGLFWVQFEDVTDLLVVPFRLSRYSMEGELVSLPPWSLREASSDSELYEAWRMSLHSKNPLVTAANGTLQHRYSRGEPALVSLNISNDTKNTCVRLDSQEALKFFHRYSGDGSDALEVEILQYLSEQDEFTNFPRLISVHEYSMGDLKNVPIAISMKYIQNSGTVWHECLRLVSQARFPEHTKEKVSRDAWFDLLRLSEHLGRLIGEFHRAMSKARHNDNLKPESGNSESHELWLGGVETKLRALAAVVSQYRTSFPAFAKSLDELPQIADTLLKSLREIQNVGLRIRTHGHLHLGQILMGVDGLFLLDYEADSMDEPSFRKLKDSCLKDISALQMSLRYAWVSAERSESSPLLETFLEKESEFGRHVIEARSQFVEPKTYTPSLEEIENALLKSYMQIVTEDAATRELLPENTMDLRTLLNINFLKRAMKESIRDFRSGNPRCKTSLRILNDFLLSRSV